MIEKNFIYNMKIYQLLSAVTFRDSPAHPVSFVSKHGYDWLNAYKQPEVWKYFSAQLESIVTWMKKLSDQILNCAQERTSKRADWTLWDTHPRVLHIWRRVLRNTTFGLGDTETSLLASIETEWRKKNRNVKKHISYLPSMNPYCQVSVEGNVIPQIQADTWMLWTSLFHNLKMP